MIEAVTDEDEAQLRGKLADDPRSLFVNNGFSPGDGVSAVVKPSFHVSKTDDGQLLMASAMIVDYTPN